MEQVPVERTTILSIDCAVAQGSIAVLRGTDVLASTDGGNESPARAEEVLSTVKRLVERADLPLSEIDSIAVSLGPGSYSGIRIGMATALGLARAFSMEPVGVSVLDALTLERSQTGRLITAVGVGKRHTAWCLFDMTGGGPEKTSPALLETDDEFIANIKSLGDTPLIWSSDLSLRLKDRLPKNIPACEPGATIAELIGTFVQRFPERTSFTPQYLRNQTEGR